MNGKKEKNENGEIKNYKYGELGQVIEQCPHSTPYIGSYNCRKKCKHFIDGGKGPWNERTEKERKQESWLICEKLK